METPSVSTGVKGNFPGQSLEGIVVHLTDEKDYFSGGKMQWITLENMEHERAELYSFLPLGKNQISKGSSLGLRPKRFILFGHLEMREGSAS